MLQLYQAEWCPYSHRVRQRLTELGVDFVAKQVPAEPDDRRELRRLSGDTAIPVLAADDGEIVKQPDEIIAWLDERFAFRPDAEAHRRKAIEEAEELAESPPAWP